MTRTHALRSRAALFTLAASAIAINRASHATSGNHVAPGFVTPDASLEEPRMILRLRQPVTATGLAGIRKEIDSLALLPDDLPEFERALTMH